MLIYHPNRLKSICTFSILSSQTPKTAQYVEHHIAYADALLMDAISSAGLSGMLYGFTKVDQSSARVVEAFTPPNTDDGVQALTDLKAAEQQVKASAAVVQTAKEMEEAVLDIIA